MAVYVYHAVGADGRKVTAELEAGSRREVFRQLDQQRLQPVAVELKQGSASAAQLGQPSARAAADDGLVLRRAQIILFTEELSDLLEAGLQLEPALQTMERRSELGGLKQLVLVLREKVVRGVSFSAALRTSSRSFGELYCNLVAAGELSGSLPNILRRQARYLQTLDELQNKVIQSLIYPSFIFGSAALLMVIFMTYLVPQLTKLLAETGKSMPLATRLLVGFSELAGHYGWLVLAAAAVAGLLFGLHIHRPEGRLWWDRQKLTLPLIGAVIAARFYAQFSQTLANLVGNGIPLLNALKLLQFAIPNAYLQALFVRITAVVGEGGSFSRALKNTGHFPPLFVDMVAIGEQTGDMAAALEKVAARYERELTVRIQRLTALIQPVIIVVMALLVGVVAYAMISGIFQTISGLRIR
ncbi:MAG: type II secretion system F family protein [Verrucomicrobiales bacterium]|jgi:type II secretory pathway component PulF|nr:type II secretion system F family protein [Verrucomicrobiales bacterium]